MVWKWILRGLLALSQDPHIRAWVEAKARKLIEKAKADAAKHVADLHEAAGLSPDPKPKLSKLIRVDKDVLKPGQMTVVDGKAYRVTRLLTSNSKETVYEGVEA